MSSPEIGGLNEKGLHRSLKNRYLTPESSVEETVDGYIVDVAGPDGIIEIQTGSFSSIKKKLTSLLADHKVRLVHPVAVETRITLFGADGRVQARRKSPKKGSIYTAASELLYIADQLRHPGLSVEVLLVRQEEIRLADGRGSWRRGGISITDRRLLEVTGSHFFSDVPDYSLLLPDGLPEIFGNREIAAALSGINSRGKIRLAGQITWLLRRLELLDICGKDGKRMLFRRNF